MIGLDTDTSGLEQVSCSACCSNTLHAPHKCQILRERMHLLLLHISNTKNVLEPSSEVKVSNKTASSIDLHQSTPAHETPKSCSMNKVLITTDTMAPLCPGSVIGGAGSTATIPTVTQIPSTVSDSCKPVKTSSSTSLSKTEVVFTKRCSKGRSLVREVCTKNHKGGKIRGAPKKFSGRHIQDINGKLLSNRKEEAGFPIQSGLNPLSNIDDTCQSNQSFKPTCKKPKHVKRNKANTKLTELFKMLESGALQVQCPSPSNNSIEQMTTLEELEKQLMSHPKSANILECQPDNPRFLPNEEKLQPTVSEAKTSIQSFHKFKFHKKRVGCAEFYDKKDLFLTQFNGHHCGVPCNSDERERLCISCKSGVSSFPTLDSSICAEAKTPRVPYHFDPSRFVSPTTKRINPMRNSNFAKHQTKNFHCSGTVSGHQKNFCGMRKPPFVKENSNFVRECSFFHPMHHAEVYYPPVGWSYGNSSEPARILSPYPTFYPSSARLQSNICNEYQRQSKFTHGYRLPHSLLGTRFNAIW